jgi:hypothetical protein
VEVEVLSERVWGMDGDEVLARLVGSVDVTLGVGSGTAAG